ncbi:MAG TPA: efflux RND transporter periplasmic adaptor subunit [Phycisphaerales bacterium]|nr:efflux RND transporter periplasmic adaptor subunit [Phycisphaerales bacterium]
MTKSRSLGMKIGLLLVIGAIVCVVFIKRKEAAPEETTLIRPLKTFVVGSDIAISGRKYPGKVSADQSVNLAFQVDGPLIEFPVKNGDEVTKGQVLGKLDPRDYEKALVAAKSEYEKAKTQLGRIKKAHESGAVSGTDLTNAETAFETSKAAMETSQKALKDTVLVAKFDGIISNTYVDKFENVKAKQAILTLQDVTSVTIEVNVPEERIATAEMGKERLKFRFVATFDYFPNREFDVTVKEFTTEADPITQTYLITFSMPSPKDVTILPGMTATIQEYKKVREQVTSNVFPVPVTAVPIDEQGKYYVWKAKAMPDGKTYTVHKTIVKVGEMARGSIKIIEGLSKGDRIAAAGVNFLQEGQQVYLLDTQAGSK